MDYTMRHDPAYDFNNEITPALMFDRTGLCGTHHFPFVAVVLDPNSRNPCLHFPEGKAHGFTGICKIMKMTAEWKLQQN